MQDAASAPPAERNNRASNCLCGKIILNNNIDSYLAMRRTIIYLQQLPRPLPTDLNQPQPSGVALLFPFSLAYLQRPIRGCATLYHHNHRPAFYISCPTMPHLPDIRKHLTHIGFIFVFLRRPSHIYLVNVIIKHLHLDVYSININVDILSRGINHINRLVFVSNCAGAKPVPPPLPPVVLVSSFWVRWYVGRTCAWSSTPSTLSRCSA